MLALTFLALLSAPPEAVTTLDETSFVGVWYELASVPAYFTKGCHGTTSTWTLEDSGRFSVRNACKKGGFDGKASGITAKAWVPDGAAPGKLVMQFVWPFKSDFWILAVDKEYRWAIAGNPKRDKLWIFSRTPLVAEDAYLDLVARARTFGYDTAMLVRTPQQAK